MIKDKIFTLDKINSELDKLIDDTKKPMSIIDIKDKYNLQFPFRVKRVIKGKVGLFEGISEITLFQPSLVGNTTISNNEINFKESNITYFYYQDAQLPHYVLYEEN